MKNKRLFGTDGIRDVAGNSVLSWSQLPYLGNALGLWITHKHPQKARVLLAYDTRNSTDFIKCGIITGLLIHDIILYDAGILPTPAVCSIMRYTKQFDYGIIISASHNPFTDNGIKIVDAHGNKINYDDEHTIEQHYDTLHQTISPFGITQNKQTAFGVMHTWSHGKADYTAIINTFFPKLSLENITIVVDCAHGATYALAPYIFEHFGAKVITINAAPNGTNINNACGSVYPQQLQNAVQLHNATIGFAFDGDGDRITIVTKNGDVKDGDDILAFLSTHPDYAHQETLVSTIMSNGALNNWLSKNNKKLLITSVGDKHVDEELEKNGLLLGGEQSGHIIVRDYLNSSDSIYLALRIMETIQYTNNNALDFLVKYPQTVINVPISTQKNLSHPLITELVEKYTQKIPEGRIYLRYSGTQNILRILLEAKDVNTMHTIEQCFQKELIETLQSL